MTIDPANLQRQLLDDLEAFATYLADEVDERTQMPPTLAPRAQSLKEVLLGIRVLLPKLKRLPLAQLTTHPAGCRHCD
jgi:hypothetical protein